MFNAQPAGSADPLPPRTSAPVEHLGTPKRLGMVLYGLCAWLQFLLVGLLTVALLLCPLSLWRRRRLVSRMARAALWLAGMRLHIGSLTGLPRPSVVVANHCSYLDGVLLAAVLPPCFSFVIKREMARVPLAGFLLRRIGVEFVERRAHGRVLRDTRRLLRHALEGRSLVFFPEGTFSSQTGLLRFHIGAFAAAARAQLPVLPIAIRGTRHCLAPGTIWPRPGHIEVEMLSPLSPVEPSTSVGGGDAGGHDARAAWLRDRARAALLAALGEPDLAGQNA